MASLIQGAKNLLTKRKAVSRDAVDSTFASLSWEDKLSTLYREFRTEDRNGRIALNRLWFMTALYFQGKQRIRWNSSTSSLDVYEPFAGEDSYVENQFRKDVWANVKSLNQGDQTPVTGPSSDKPEDVSASKVANSALDVVFEDIELPMLKTMKHMSMALFGNAFVFNSFTTSTEFGTTLIPKYKFESVDLPGVNACPGCGMTSADDVPACPQCGSPMEEVAPKDTIESKVSDGFEERPQGRNVSFVTTPLETYCRSKSRGGLRFAPYLLWVRRIDRNIVLDARPKADLGEGAAMNPDDDLSQYYIDVLSTLAGGAFDGVYESSATRYYKEVEYAMCWIRPEMFRGDPVLLKKFPSGVQFEVANGKYIEDTAEDKSMDSCWTHYAYFPNAYSFWGDGMVDCLPIQDQINETNSLMIRYLRYCTMSKKLYDQDMIVPEWLSNNPEEAWIPAQRQLEKKLSDAVFSIEPTQLSQDVGRWKLDQTQRAMPSMSGVTAASVGESTGANASYSKQVQEVEQARGQFAPMFDYNRPAQMRFVRQLLEIFRDNQLDQRKKSFIDNTGKWSFEAFSGADLGTGSFDIRIPDAETIPKTRIEKAQGLEMLGQLAPTIPLLSQKDKIYVLDFIGMSAESNPETLQIQRAWRNIQKIEKGARDITPMLFIDNLAVQIPTYQEYLASEDGDRMAEENPEAFSALYTLLTACTQMKMMQDMAMSGMGGQPQGPQPGGPQAPKGQQPAPDKPRTAQAPGVADEQKVEMPPLPAGAQQ